LPDRPVDDGVFVVVDVLVLAVVAAPPPSPTVASQHPAKHSRKKACVAGGRFVVDDAVSADRLTQMSISIDTLRKAGQTRVTRRRSR
jgi:hypothetical protein